MKQNIKTVRNDMRTLVHEAQDLFREATLATGERAEELRSKGLALLESAMEKAQEAQAIAVEKGKQVAKDTDEFVHEHPWKAVGIAAGVGLVVGMLIARR
ncbi:DUF883 domain-containing protein [Oxalobacteraceae bacterium OM1]|nr:DUF883 domain-containing protein [Oxalobacteraceae bacterium OM1]